MVSSHMLQTLTQLSAAMNSARSAIVRININYLLMKPVLIMMGGACNLPGIKGVGVEQLLNFLK